MASTPPHHPTHGVNLTYEEIRTIITTIHPGRQATSVDTLARGKSFNNRLYFVSTTWPGKEKEKQLRHDSEVVLKVSGTNFGPEKARNEIACLLLLEYYCPETPAPRVLAWSDDCSTIQKKKSSFQDKDGALRVSHEQIEISISQHHWILLTKVPGRTLCEADFSDLSAGSLMKQIAGCLAAWRSGIPGSFDVGNCDMVSDEQSTTPLVSIISNAKLLLCDKRPSAFPRTRLDYYKARLENEVDRLKQDDIFKSSRATLSEPLSDFFKDKLPQLELMKESGAPFIFTHYDLSPRNILVAEGLPLTLTGIVDFEFAGFFPAEEEFTNLSITNKGDWPEELEKWLYGELDFIFSVTKESLPQGLPFTQACSIIEMVNNIAPWWLLGREKSAETEDELTDSRNKVLESMNDLQNTK